MNFAHHAQVSGSVTLRIVEGTPIRLSARKETLNAMSEAIASNAVFDELSKKRVIAENVTITAIDVGGNECVFPIGLSVICSLRLPESSVSPGHHAQDLSLPVLVGCDPSGSLSGVISVDGMSFVFPKLELMPGQGGGEGRVELCFRVVSLTDSLTADIEDWITSFHFTSDNARAERSSNLLSKLTALENRVTDYERRKAVLDDAMDSIQRNIIRTFEQRASAKGVLQTFFSNPLSFKLSDLIRLRNELSEQRSHMESRASQIRPSKKKVNSSNSGLLAGKSVTGLVADLGYVDDYQTAYVLSWAASHRMDALVVPDYGTARELYENGIKAWAEDQICNFRVTTDRSSLGR